MHLLKILVLILTAMVTQSCKITMPSLVELLTSYDARTIRPDVFIDAFDFNSRAVVAQGGFKDLLVIGDDPESGHGRGMLRKITGPGIPEENVRTFKDLVPGVRYNSRLGHWNRALELFVSDEWTWLHEKTRVVHWPYTPLSGKMDIPRFVATNVLFVRSAGNVRGSSRDLYNINHEYWSVWDESYKYTLESFKTGKVIIATSAEVTASGDIQPRDNVVQCGDAKESCFTIIPGQYTSDASARLAAMSFYLSQFYETPEEITETLNICAVDIGEPGVDREYGRGMANLLCPRVLKKEIEVVSQYFEKPEEPVRLPKGGVLDGTWRAENTPLQVHMPAVLKETLSAQYQGVVNGTVEFNEDTVTMDFTAEAVVTVVFLLPIEATAEDMVHTSGVYTTEDTRLRIPSDNGTSLEYTYEATEDSLHLVKTLSLNELLRLLPGSLGDLAKKDTQPSLEDDPIHIRVSFERVKPPGVPGDFNGDENVDFADFLLFTAAFGTTVADSAFDEQMDFTSDGMINFADFLVFINLFEQG